MDRNECWLTFTEALEMYLSAREEKASAPPGSHRWERACEEMGEGARHMDALTALPSNTKLPGR